MASPWLCISAKVPFSMLSTRCSLASVCRWRLVSENRPVYASPSRNLSSPVMRSAMRLSTSSGARLSAIAGSVKPMFHPHSSMNE